jgi:methylmalonyl-CoA mutase N-terminal domain/subunit
VDRTLKALCAAAMEEPATKSGQLSSANTMPYILDCVRAYATVGEICAALREVMGTYTEVSIA